MSNLEVEESTRRIEPLNGSPIRTYSVAYKITATGETRATTMHAYSAEDAVFQTKIMLQHWEHSILQVSPLG